MSSNPYFAPVAESARLEASKILRASKQEGQCPLDLKQLLAWASYELRFVRISEQGVGARAVQSEGEWWIEVDCAGSDRDDDFASSDTARRRQRFSVAHELGHLTFKSHCDIPLQNRLLDFDNPHSTSYRLQKEAQANEFATELLLPHRIFRECLKGLDFRSNLFASLEQISDKFDVSLTAVAKRAAAFLDIPAMAMYFAPDGKTHQIPSSSKFSRDAGFYFEKGWPLPELSLAKRILDGVHADSWGRQEYVDTRVWFPHRKKKEQYSVVEWCKALGQYGVLVILELIELDEY